MEKLWAIAEILKLILAILKDTDSDGVIDILDKDPENPAVQ